MLARADPRAAARYFLTGEAFGAARGGHGSAWSPPGTTRSDGMLDGLRAASPQGLAESKELTTAPAGTALADARRDWPRSAARLFASAEAAEGMRAFLERREPPWAL